MYERRLVKQMFGLMLIVLMLAGCGGPQAEPTATPPPPTATPAPPPAPSARGYHQMAYDVESDRVILFGGSPKPASLLGDTWAYGPGANSWTKMNPAQSPPPSHGPLAYDIQSDRVVVFVGFILQVTSSVPLEATFEARSETWAYDYNTDTWENMQPETEAPAGLVGARMAYDAESDRMILFGGMDAEALNTDEFKLSNDTWAYDLESNTWTKMKPATRPEGRIYYPIVYDANADRVVLFGGGTLSDVNDMWAYDYNADTWEELKPSGIPPLRAHCDLVYDAQADRMILFGGTSSVTQGERPLGDTWAYHWGTNTWTELKPDPAPVERGWHAAAYSTKAKRVILFGGGTIRDAFGNETWIYDPKANTWTNVTSGP